MAITELSSRFRYLRARSQRQTRALMFNGVRFRIEKTDLKTPGGRATSGESSAFARGTIKSTEPYCPRGRCIPKALSDGITERLQDPESKIIPRSPSLCERELRRRQRRTMYAEENGRMHPHIGTTNLRKHKEFP